MKKPGARAIYFTAAEMRGIEHAMLNQPAAWLKRNKWKPGDGAHFARNVLLNLVGECVDKDYRRAGLSWAPSQKMPRAPRPHQGGRAPQISGARLRQRLCYFQR